MILGLAATPIAAQSLRESATSSRSPITAAVSGEGTARSEVEILRDEVADLRRQMGELTAMVRALRTHATGAPVDRDGSATGEAVQAPAASPSLPVRLTGRVVSSSAFNSSDANWIDAPNLVGLASGGSVTSTLRQSRLGVGIGRSPVGSWAASGALEVDFFGGTPGFATGTVMGLPRLLRAFGRFEHGRTAVHVGQDDVQLAPRDPTSLAALAFPQFFRSGNLFLRAPQLRVEQRVGRGWTIGGGVVAPVAGDAGPTFVFAAPPGGGERSERPAFEGRLAYAGGSADAPSEAQVGVAGHLGWIRQAGQLTTASGVALDVNLRRGRVGLAGELFAAEELDAFGAGLGQPGRATGGWVEARLAIAPRVSINGGAGLDHRPDGVGTAGRLRNVSVFGNTIVRLTPAVSTSLEYRWLQTRYGSGRDRPTHHLNAVPALEF
jgi:hypothetical protein